MKQSIVKFLEFNGKNIMFLSKNGIYYIAIRPICEALQIEFTRTFKNLKSDNILSQPLAVQPMVAADGKIRKMVCLPEFFIYGWLFSIQSDSEQLKEYKWKCYELLYEYFHGAMTDRNKFLKEKTIAENEIKTLEKELALNPSYIKLAGLKSKVSEAKKALNLLDKEIVSNQLELWNSEIPVFNEKN